MGSRLRQSLTDVELGTFDIDLSNLILLLKRTALQKDYFGLYDVHLRSGTWKEALDVLKKQKSSDRFRLLAPVGAGSAAIWDHGITEELFGDGTRLPFIRQVRDEPISKVEKYIRGLRDVNPIQAI